MAEKRIETTTSRTAEWTCLSRAISSVEKDPHYKCDDDLALRLLPDHFRALLRIPRVGRLFIHAAAAKGMYEYVIARTKYIDSVFKEALTNGFDQILIFGAGFDTRALRFQNIAGGTKIFELDVPITQEAKLRQYQKRGLSVPPGVTFIPIDFDKESLPIKLQETGFKKGTRTLFVLEGLFMYLQPDSVHETLQTIQDFAGAGSEVVFDYVHASVLRGEGRYEDERKIVESVAKAGEKWQFGIEEGQLEPLLANYGFRLFDEANATKLEQVYFTDTNRRVVGNVNRTHCLVRATKVK
jgi:methyltransferase (TIGR00027 family)